MPPRGGYGLIDSDSESDRSSSPPPSPTRRNRRAPSPAGSVSSDLTYTTTDSTLGRAAEHAPPTASLSDIEDEDEEMGVPAYSDEEPERALPARRSVSLSMDDLAGWVDRPRGVNEPWAATLKLEPSRVQVMQASLFHSGAPRPAEPQPIPLAKEAATRFGSFLGSDRAPTPKRTLPSSLPSEGVPAVENRSSFANDLDSQGALFRPTRKFARVDPEQSLARGKEHLAVDAGLALGRSFRVSWGPGGQLVHLGKLGGVSASGAAGDSPTVVKIETIDALARDDTKEAADAKRLLELQLAETEIKIDEGDGVPVAFTSLHLRFRDFAAAFASDDTSHEASLWRLASALFDEIDLRLPDSAPDDLRQRVESLRRKKALSDWLESTVSPSVEADTRAETTSTSPKPGSAAVVFALLSGHQISRACDVALEAGDVRLATLLSQLPGDEEFRADVMQQLDTWREHRVDAHIAPEYRRVYALLSGNPDVLRGTSAQDAVDRAPEIKVSEGLDWKRAFGLRLWHGIFEDSPLTSALRQYDRALAEPDNAVAPPKPWYLETPALAADARKWRLPEVETATDALYELIKLYADPTHALEAALAPTGFGPSPQDFRLPWHLYNMLSRVLQKRDFGDRLDLGIERLQGEGEDGDEVEGNSPRADAVVAGYARQLEALGLEEWAAFVLLHLEFSESRERAIKELLSRNIARITEEKDRFLVEKLSIPRTWLAEAKATLARYKGTVYAEYKLLLDAELWSDAHRIAVRKLAPEAVVREDFGLLRRLLAPFLEHDVEGWATGGKLFLDYADAKEKIPALLASTAAAAEPDASELSALNALARKLPILIKLLPDAFPDHETDVRSAVALSEMLASLMNLQRALRDLDGAGGGAGRGDVLPGSKLMQEGDRLGLLQAEAAAVFGASLGAAA